VPIVSAAPIASGRSNVVERAIAVAGILALVVTLAGIRRSLVSAVVLLGGATAAAFAYGHVGPVGVALSACGLLAVAELASASLSLRAVDRVDSVLVIDLVLHATVAAIVGGCVAAAVLVAAEFGPSGGAPWAVVGAASVALIVGLIALLVGVRVRREPD
jgi:hypothetical protein